MPDRLAASGSWLLLLGAVACTAADPRDDVAPTGGSSSAAPTTTGADATAGSTDADDPRLDVGREALGCEFVDLLFVIDNSESMQTHQEGLAAAFPGFTDALFEAVPPGVDVHVGITTTDFDLGCDAAEATQNCQSSASFDEVQSHYIPPTVAHDGGNGSQGRLFEWAGRRWFETTSDDDPAQLEAWFTAAATAAGEEGCSFEMPVAAAGWAFDPANDEANAGFLRDDNALLVVFFLTDEPDKSFESKDAYVDKILQAKAGCGGAPCVFASGLVPACTLDVNQKLWQFMGSFGTAEPPWGDINDAANYSALVGDALATAIAEACADIPVG